MNAILFQVLLYAIALILVVGFWAIFGMLEEVRNEAQEANAQLKRIADEVIDDLSNEGEPRR